MTEQKFEHNGVTITLTSYGNFQAAKNGAMLKAPSLPAMKKKLDKLDTFTPFKALYARYYSEEYEVVTVTGVRKHRGGSVWILSNGAEREDVIEATPENTVIAKAYKKLKAKNSEIRGKMESEERALAQKLVHKKAGKS